MNREEVLTMLKTVFSTLTVAMRYEPANAKFFATDVSTNTDETFIGHYRLYCNKSDGSLKIYSYLHKCSQKHTDTSSPM